MKRLILALLTGAVFAASSPAYAAVKTIVLVHGAFADGSGWKPVADILISHGYSVRVVQEPETSFDATWLRPGAFSTRPVLVSWSDTVMAA
jgi:triacylglycerol esterase/lipase EstA (alpha/beta hydrolase family)